MTLEELQEIDNRIAIAYHMPACILSGHFPRFSTDWAAAGELLEVLRERFGTVTFEAYRVSEPNLRNQCKVGNSSLANAETGPLAICLAALEAVKGKP